MITGIIKRMVCIALSLFDIIIGIAFYYKTNIYVRDQGAMIAIFFSMILVFLIIELIDYVREFYY